MFTLNQQVFALGMASNCNSLPFAERSRSYKLASDLGERLKTLGKNPIIQKHMPGWTIAWGPGCYKAADGRGPCDNAMVVFARTDKGATTYVVSVAGTNGMSHYDWEKINLAVGKTVSWPDGGPGGSGACVSKGTWLGLHNILHELRDKFDQPLSLPTFLKQAAKPTDTVIFAGHSLGATLSVVLALFIYPNGSRDSGWKEVLVYPTAGATPGNAAFADRFDAAFPVTTAGDSKEQWAVFNALLWNQWDIVPHSWAMNPMPGPNMDEIPGLFDYPAGSEMPRRVGALVDAVKRVTNDHRYAAVHNLALTGYPKSSAANVFELLNGIGNQHAISYFALLDVWDLLLLPFYSTEAEVMAGLVKAGLAELFQTGETAPA